MTAMGHRGTALVSFACSALFAYQLIFDPNVRHRGSNRPLKKWQSILFIACFTILSFAIGVFLWMN